ncbi:hypothetical protein A1O3_09056 [Capronia epimyces CBS 606.96]|uniref:Elongin-A n=1 Tax=Capronia epimyces CBS 606.96 TaxID=1182542 RepID=W9XBQ4_9EURO|nr:uncharacterized protein A1O3_09056 [Capronia epimyces CBS 606.96]EXJ77897.1 hypothetical protein A1O3_09056 [Capronia epimyces CBS 606.96]
MPADTLFNMARRACIRCSGRITDIGDLDYELVRPVLLKIESPEKLHQIERASPQIIGKDAELWMTFIKRDIADWHLKPHEPKDPKNWYKVYCKLKEDARLAAIADEAMLKVALASIKNEKEQNVTQIASRVNLPASKRARINYNYISGRTGSKGAHKMTMLEKIKKEARDAKASRMNRPMHELPKRATTVTRPPQQFVDDLKQKAATPVSPALIRNPGPIRTSRPPLHAPKPGPAELDASYDLTRDREARLRALKSGRAASNPTASLPGSTARNPPVPATRSDPQIQARLTLDFLETPDEHDVEPPRKLLKVNEDDRPRSGSPMRLNPQPQRLQRKLPPSPFMSTPRKMAKRPGIS